MVSAFLGFFGGKIFINNKHRHYRGLSREWVRVKLVYVLPFAPRFAWLKKTHEETSQEISKHAGTGTIPGIFLIIPCITSVYAFFVVVFVALLQHLQKGPPERHQKNCPQRLSTKRSRQIAAKKFDKIRILHFVGKGPQRPHRRSKKSTKNGAAVGGSLENFILARNFQSRSKSL